MCQAIRDGGRRCPIHQHQTIAVVRAATEASGLNRRQVESLFREVRREGRDADLVNQQVQDNWRDNLRSYAQILNNEHGLTGFGREISQHIARGVEHDNDPDGATQYAQRNIIERANQRGRNLRVKFEEIAERTGLTTAEVQARFNEFFEQVDISRGAGDPPEYNPTVRARAVRQNLPYDRASVTALERLNALPAASTDPERRVRHIDALEGSHIQSFGYDPDGGRLEVIFRSNPDAIYAYRNIPADLWERLSTAERPGRIYSARIRGNDDFMYESQAAAEADAYRVRCASCGQFRAVAHACPQVAERDQIAASGTDAADIEGQLRDVFEQHGADLDATRATNTNRARALLGGEPYSREMTDDQLLDEISYELEMGDPHGRLPILVGAYRTRVAYVAGSRWGDFVGMDEDHQQFRNYDFVSDEEAEYDDPLRVARLNAGLNVDGTTPASDGLADWERELLNTSDSQFARLADNINSASDGLADWERELLNATETLEPVREIVTEADEAPVTTPTDTAASGIALSDIVVPADTEGLDEAELFPGRVPFTGEQFDGSRLTGFAWASGPLPELNDVTQTPDGQYVPQRFNTESITVHSATSATNEFFTYRGAPSRYHDRLPAEMRDIVNGAPEYIHFVTERDGYQGTYTGVFAFDSRQYEVVKSQSWNAEDNRWENKIECRAINRQAAQPSGEDRANGGRAAERAYERELRTETTMLDNLRENGVSERIATNQTGTRRYVFDANLPEQPSIRVPATNALRRTIRENHVAEFPVEIDFTAQNHTFPERHVDDQGYSLGRQVPVHIIGNMAVRRNEHGVIEPITSHRQLRCDCADYQARYYCQHLNYAQRHMGNVVQQMLPPNIAAGRTIIAAETRADGTPLPPAHRLLTSALRERSDASVAADTDGTEYLRSTNAMVRGTRGRSRGSDITDRYVLPARLNPARRSNPTHNELEAMRQYQNLMGSLTSIYAPNAAGPFRDALVRSDVEMPFQAEFAYRDPITGENHDGNVTGGIRFAQLPTRDTDLREVQIRSNTLRCSCGRFRGNNVCEHTQAVQDQAYAMVQTGNNRAQGVERSMSLALLEYQERITTEGEVRSAMANRSMGRREAERWVADREARERREAEERREHERQLRVRREQEVAERARREAEALLRHNREIVRDSAAYRERMTARWAAADVTSYAANPEQFFTDYQDALTRKRNHEDAVPFRTENVTDGVCADEPGARQFGIELEFDIKRGVDKYEALRKIGRDLHAAGLTTGSSQVPYHSAGRNGYASWSFETDATVDAELVSPLMKDTPEHWEQLRKALEIIKQHGGIASTRAGSHVHVSTGSYESSSAKHVELLRTVNNNDDILYRLASNPSRGTHRGMRWCSPNVNDSNGDIPADVLSAQNVLGYEHSSHGLGLNFEGTHNQTYRRSNIEFRMWDSTLDPAVIQQQVMVSAAITDYAERNVMETGMSRQAHNERLNVGSGRRAEERALTGRNATHTAETFQTTNGHVATFLDKLFRRAEDRATVASLFAVTKWQNR